MNQAMIINTVEVKGMRFGRVLWKRQERSFRVKKKESHTQEQDKIALMLQGAFSSNPVYVYDKKFTRPLYAHFEKIPHDPKKDKYNPRSDDWDTYATEEAYAQAQKANKTNQKTPLAMLILVALAVGPIAFMIGYLLALHPNVAGVIGQNGASTQTITNTVSSIINSTTHTQTTSTSTDANGGIHIFISGFWRALFP